MTTSPFAIEVERIGTRPVGGTNLRVGAIGLGCMGMTGVYDTERRDDRRSAAALNRALDLGVTYLDTADSFGPFGNEKLLGSTLAVRRREAFIATKVGITGRSDGTFHHNGTPEHIRAAVDDSLRRLQSDRIDTYILQAVDPQVPVEESWGAMAELVAAGKVRTLGIRSQDPRIINRAQQVFPVSVVTAELSYWEQGNLPLVRFTRDRGMAFVASSPLGRGFLTGTIGAGRVFKWTDLRSKMPKFKAESLPAHLPVLDPLREVARTRGVKPAQVALAWLLHQGPNVIPIPGSTDPAHVTMNAGAAHLGLSAEDLAVLSGQDGDVIVL